MENRASLPDQSMMSAYAFIQTQGINMPVDTFLEYSAFAFTRVKPLNVTTKAELEVLENGVVELPVDFKYVKAVSGDVNYWREWKVAQELDTGEGLRYIDGDGTTIADYSNANNRVLGDYIDFKRVGKSQLEVTTDLVGEMIYVLGSAPYLDDENLPYLTEKQVEALAYQVIVLYGQSRINQGCQFDLQYYSQLASKRTAQSRVPDFISDNQWNEILDVRTSMDRKVYNRDFKFRK